MQLGAHYAEVLEEVLLAHFVLARYVGLAQRHQVVDVVAGVVNQAAHGAVGHHLVGNHYRAHVQVNELPYVFHLRVERQLKPAEDVGHHLCAHEVVVMERPSGLVAPALRLGLAYVVQQGRPAQPQVVRLAADVVEHLKRVIEVVLMRAAVAGFNDVKIGKLGQYARQQSAAVQVDEALARRLGHHYLVKLLGYALAADNADALGVAPEGVEGFVFDEEVELRGEAYAAQHAQRVVREGHVRVERRAYYAVLKVGQAVEGVYKLAEARAVEAHGKGVNGEVAAVLVVLQRAVFYHGLARVVAVALLAGADELHLKVLILHLGRAEIAEDGQLGPLAEPLLQRLGYAYAAAYNHHVDVV